MAADMNNFDAVSGQGFAMMPVIAIDCIQDRGVLRVCAGQRNEDTVVPVEAVQSWVVWKLDIVCFSLWVGCKRNLRYAVCPVTIVDQPFEEQVTNARLTRK